MLKYQNISAIIYIVNRFRKAFLHVITAKDLH